MKRKLDLFQPIRTLVQDLASHGYVVDGEITLSSGAKVQDYLDCRRAWSRSPSLLHRIGRKILGELREDVVAVGGMTLGADPLAYATSLYSVGLDPKCRVSPFVVWKKSKRHGTKSRIEGCPAEGSLVCVLEDVVTTGKSVLEAVQVCHSAGLEVVQVLVVVDRDGGLKKVREGLPEWIEVSALMTLDEIRAVRKELYEEWVRGCFENDDVETGYVV